MKPLRVALLAVAGMLAGILVQAQTVDEVINKHIEALGGKDKLNSIKSIYTEFTMDVQGNQANGMSYLVNGKGYRYDIDFGGQKIIQVITDKGGWMVNPFMGSTSAMPMPEAQAKAGVTELYPGGPLLNYADKGFKVELMDKENGAHKIKLTTKEGAEFIYTIDPQTYYITKTVSRMNIDGQDIETTAVFSDFKKDEGFVSPYSVELTMPQGYFTISTSKVELNKDIDMKLFEMQ